MRWAMARGIALLVVAYGLTWSVLLTTWVTVGDRSLTGTDMSQTLTLLPAIAILIALIALYRKAPRILVVVSGVTIAFAGYLGLTTDYISLPAALELQESLTGIAGNSGLGEVTIFPSAFSVMALACCVVALVVSRLGFSRRPSVDEAGSSDDARGIWDEQS